MTTKPHDNAFAGVTKDGYANGLSKREYFAAIAMQGFIAAMKERKAPAEELIQIPHNTATWAVAYADALIEQLNK